MPRKRHKKLTSVDKVNPLKTRSKLTPPTNNERVGKALELLRAGLGPFVEREVQRAVTAGRLVEVPQYESDAAGLLRLMWQSWYEVFREVLGPAERSLVGEMRGHRNRWAHQKNFSSDDAYRTLDSANRLLAAVSAPQAAEVENMKAELGRLIYDQPVHSEQDKAGGKEYPSAEVENMKTEMGRLIYNQPVRSERYKAGSKEYPCPIPGCQQVFRKGITYSS